MEGYSETFDASTAGHAPLAENAETANYADFHTMKLALRNQNDNQDNQNNQDNDNSSNLPNSPIDYSPTVNWYALTSAQIAQLQTIAERSCGRVPPARDGRGGEGTPSENREEMTVRGICRDVS